MKEYTIIQVQSRHLEKLLTTLAWRRFGTLQSATDTNVVRNADSIARDIAAKNLWIWAAEDGQYFCGYLSAVRMPRPDGRVCLYVDEVWVAPPFRRQGIGRALMTALLATMKDKQVWRIRLNVHPDNHEARALYTSCGFREVESVFCEVHPHSRTAAYSQNEETL